MFANCVVSPDFDTKAQSWLKTPSEIRELGGAIFTDRRFGRVFVYRNFEPHLKGPSFSGPVSSVRNSCFPQILRHVKGALRRLKRLKDPTLFISRSTGRWGNKWRHLKQCRQQS
jgi:hypothetical protein